MKFNNKWNLTDLAKVGKKNIKVFTAFACGGGSTMGYKLNGLHVKYVNDIDPQMADIYKENHHPDNYYLCDIRELLEDKNTQSIKDVDILDGSPPCSSFSTAGRREKDWGKEKMFKEGQSKQILDDLFFRFLDLADILKPKIIIAENVSGMLKGNAMKYTKNVLQKFDDIGYNVQLFLFNSATMGVPQKRERVFFIASKKELNYPKLKMEFNQKPITFGEIRSDVGVEPTEHVKSLFKYYIKSDSNLGDITARLIPGKLSQFNAMILKDDKVTNTLTASGDDYREYDKMKCNQDDYTLRQTFPLDYNYKGLSSKYVCGMSVPPVMMANIVSEIIRQWKL